MHIVKPTLTKLLIQSFVFRELNNNKTHSGEFFLSYGIDYYDNATSK
jgi:hypothetical protein